MGVRRTLRASYLEEYFARLWRQHGCKCPLQAEYRFHPPRLFRFDFAWPDKKVAVEIEGGIYMAKGGHTNVKGFNANCEKHNLATLDGWRFFRFTEKMLTNDPVGCVETVRKLLKAKESKN